MFDPSHDFRHLFALIGAALLLLVAIFASYRRIMNPNVRDLTKGPIDKYLPNKLQVNMLADHIRPPSEKDKQD